MSSIIYSSLIKETMNLINEVSLKSEPIPESTMFPGVGGKLPSRTISEAEAGFTHYTFKPQWGTVHGYT